MARPKGHVLDDIDIEIIRVLQQDAAIAIVDLGAKVGLHFSACRRRKNELVKSGYIKIVADIDVKKSNWRTTSYMLVSLPPAKTDGDTIERFGKYVASIEAISLCDEVAGEFDFFLRLEAHGNEVIETIRRDIISNFPNSETKIVGVMKNYKKSALPPEALK